MKKFNQIVQMTLVMSALLGGVAQAEGKFLLGHTSPTGVFTPVELPESQLAFDRVLQDDREGFRVTTADGLHTVIRTEVDTVVELPAVEGQQAPMELRLRKRAIVRIDFTEGRLSVRNLHDEKNGSVVVAFVGAEKGSRLPLGNAATFDATGAHVDSSKPELIQVSDKKTMQKYLKDVVILDSMGFYKKA